MNKSRSSIYLVAFVVLFTIGVTPYLTQDAFAASPTISAYVANDPDDIDRVFGAGDTITINTNIPTNATLGNVTNAAFVTGNFTFVPDPLAGLTFVTDWTANWISSTALEITFININNVLTITTSTVDTTGGNTIGDQTIDEAGMTSVGTVPLTGDFGLFGIGGSGCSNCEAPTLGVNKNFQRLVDNGFSYNGKSVDVERYFTPYPLVTVQTGKQNVAEFKIYDDKGPDRISHFELAFGLASGESIGMSKAVINWDKTFDGIETVTLDDPENVLDNIKVTTSEGSCSDDSSQKCLILKVKHTFRAPLDFNILGTNVWDFKRNAWQNYYNHGIEVVGESLNPPKEYDGINRGHIYHLTETGKNTAVDEFGNTWTLDKTWTKDYVKPERIVDSDTNVFTRMHSEFAQYKDSQADLASSILSAYYRTSINYEESFSEINEIFAYEYPETFNSKFDSPELQKNLIIESEKAQKIMNHLLDSLLYRQQ